MAGSFGKNDNGGDAAGETNTVLGELLAKLCAIFDFLIAKPKEDCGASGLTSPLALQADTLTGTDPLGNAGVAWWNLASLDGTTAGSAGAFAGFPWSYDAGSAASPYFGFRWKLSGDALDALGCAGAPVTGLKVVYSFTPTNDRDGDNCDWLFGLTNGGALETVSTVRTAPSAATPSGPYYGGAMCGATSPLNVQHTWEISPATVPAGMVIGDLADWCFEVAQQGADLITVDDVRFEVEFDPAQCPPAIEDVPLAKICAEETTAENCDGVREAANLIGHVTASGVGGGALPVCIVPRDEVTTSIECVQVDGDQAPYSDGDVLWSIVSLLGGVAVGSLLVDPADPETVITQLIVVKACPDQPEVQKLRCVLDAAGVRWDEYAPVDADGAVGTSFYISQETGAPGAPVAPLETCPSDLLSDYAVDCPASAGESVPVVHEVENNNTDFSFSYNNTTLKLQGQNPFNSASAQPAIDEIKRCIAANGEARIDFTDPNGNVGRFVANGILSGTLGDFSCAFSGVGDTALQQSGKVRTMVVTCTEAGTASKVLGTLGCLDEKILAKLCQIENNTSPTTRQQVLAACDDTLGDGSVKVNVFVRWTFVQGQPVVTELFSDVALTQIYNGNVLVGTLVDCITGEAIEEPEPIYLTVKERHLYEVDDEKLLLIDSGGGFAEWSYLTETWQAVPSLSVPSAGAGADADNFRLYAITAAGLQVVDAESKTVISTAALTSTDGSPTSFSAAHFYNGTLYAAANSATGWRIYQIDVTTAVVTAFSGPWTGVVGSGTSLAINPVDGKFYVMGTGGRVYEIGDALGSSGAAALVYTSPGGIANGATFDANGDLFLTGGPNTYRVADFGVSNVETQIIDDWSPGANSITYYRTRAAKPGCFIRKIGCFADGSQEIIGDFNVLDDSPREIVGGISCDAPCCEHEAAVVPDPDPEPVPLVGRAHKFNGNAVQQLPVPAGQIGNLKTVLDTGAGLIYFTLDGSAPGNTPTNATGAQRGEVTGPYAVLNLENIDLSLVRFDGSSGTSDYTVIYEY